MFYNAECSAPWYIRAPPSHLFGPYIASPASHIIEFHLLTQGRGYVRVGEETTPLTAGDIVMMPHGDAHYMGNGPQTRPASGSRTPSADGARIAPHALAAAQVLGGSAGTFFHSRIVTTEVDR